MLKKHAWCPAIIPLPSWMDKSGLVDQQPIIIWRELTMKFILPIALALTASAWGMEQTKTEKDPQLFPIGSLTLNIDERTFSGEIIDEIAHYASEFVPLFTAKYSHWKDKVGALKEKIATSPELQNATPNTSHYYTSKLAYLKDKRDEYEKRKDAFSALPKLFNQILLLTLKNPLLLSPCTTTVDCSESSQEDSESSQENNESETLLYYAMPRHDTIFNHPCLPQLENQHPLLRQINLGEFTCSEQDETTWEKIMETFEEFSDDKQDKTDVLDPQNMRLYVELHMINKMIKKTFPAQALEALGSFKSIRNEVIENRKGKAEKDDDLSTTMVNILIKINETLGTFKNDVETLYSQAAENM